MIGILNTGSEVNEIHVVRKSEGTGYCHVTYFDIETIVLMVLVIHDSEQIKL